MHATQGDQAKAVALYEWNITASGALYEALAMIEVVVRNAIHDQMAAWHQAEGHAKTWLDDPQRRLEHRATADIAAARERAESWRKVNGKVQPTRPDPPVGAIVAELNFGFWRFLLARRYEGTLWTHAIRHGFPGARNRRAVEDPMMQLHKLRNRVAHLEPIFARNLRRDEAAMSQVLDAICPTTSDWARRLRRVQDVDANRP